MACESISYHDTILGRVWEGGEEGNMEVVAELGWGGGGCACNSITHTGSDHELSRQSVKAYRITTPFWAESGRGEGGDTEVVTQSG